MANFIQHLVAGLSAGGIYATLALALVLIHRATGTINFAQGEMGMFLTYIAWALMTELGAFAEFGTVNYSLYWVAFLVTLVIAFFGGALVHQVVIRPFERRPELTVVMVTIALLLLLNGA